MRFQPHTQIQIAPINRISYDPGNGNSSLPQAFDHVHSQFGLCLEAHRLGDSSGSTPIPIFTPIEREIQFTINKSMSLGRHIREKDPNLTVLHPSSGSTVLPANASRFLALFGKTGFIDSHNGRCLAQLLEHVGARGSSRTPSVSQTAEESRRCIPSGRASLACSANCQPFFREISLRIPRRKANARRCGSGRAKRGAIRACRRKRAWPQRQISPGVVLLPMEVVWWSCFIFFSFLRLLWFSGSHLQSVTCGRRSWGFFCFSGSSC
jgi:hypothetical protein